MNLSFARCSYHPMSRNFGRNTPSLVPVERGRICKSSCQYREFPGLDCNRPRIRGVAGKKFRNIKSTYENREALTMYSNEQFLSSSTMFGYRELYKLLNAFYEFCRPYTMIGTVISVISISLLPLSSLAEVSPNFVVGVSKALILFLLMQFYVGGINQIYDVEIDKINKPYLPLASGIFSMEFGIKIVTLSIILCFALGIMFQSPPLLLGVILYFVAGSGYSIDLPFMRWKRNPFLSMMAIIVARALIIPFATFVHIQKYVLGGQIFFPRSLIFTSCFACLFSIVVALSKDIPDIDGDKLFGFESLLAVRLGKERVFRICISILVMIYGCAMGIGFSSSHVLSKLVTVLGHFALASAVLNQALRIDLSVQGSGSKFYMFVWKLMYAEYFLIPFVR